MLYLHAHPVSKPLSFCTSIFTEKVPHLYTFLLKKRYPLTFPLEHTASLFLSLRMKSREHWSRIFRRDVNQTNKYSIFSSCSHGTRKISHFKNTFIWKASQSRVKWRLSFCDILFCSRYSQNWVGMCGPLPKTLTLFMTKICDIPYPIYHLTKTSKPNLWPNPHIKIVSQTCIITRRLKNVKNRAFLTLLRSQKHYVIFSKKTLPKNNLTGPSCSKTG